MKKIGVMISGGGSNLQSIIDATILGDINGEVVLVVSTNRNAFGLQRAIKHGIATFVAPKSEYRTLDERFEAVGDQLIEQGVDLVVLAGCLAILPKAFVERFKGKLINIHPSLLPKYGGKGFYGKRVHQAVIDQGDKVSGCTVHYVDEGTDTGEIIGQCEVEVKREDTAESLSARILPYEHSLLVEVIAKLLKED